MIGLVDRERVDAALYDDYETEKAREKRLAKEARAQEMQAKSTALGKKVKEASASKVVKGRDIENSISKILKFIKNQNHSSEDGIPKHSANGTEVAQYDRVTEEFEKVVSRRRSRKTPVSSFDSDSEYFSSEEVEANKRRSEKEHHHHHSVFDSYTNEIVPKLEATQFEEQLTSLKKEVGSLSQQKRDLELQAKNLSSENVKLRDQVMELELLLKEEKSVVSDLKTKLNDKEKPSKVQHCKYQ